MATSDNRIPKSIFRDAPSKNVNAMFPDTLKRLLVIAHRWLALALAPIFLLILLSGAILAFKPIVGGAGPSAPANVDTVVAALEVIDPTHQATSVSLSADGRSIRLKSNDPAVVGTFDLATRTPAISSDFDLFAFALDLHKNLLVGVGLVVEIATYVMVAILAIGLFLGLPRLRNTLMGWHSGLGWLALPLVALAPVTGLLMILHIGTPTLPMIEPAAQPLPLARALEATADQVDLTRFVAARRFRQGSALLTATTAEGPMRYLVSGTGKVVPLTDGPGWVRQLHEGTWAGIGSGILSFLAAAAPMGLMVTGLYSWLRRQRQARRRDGDHNAATLVAFASQTGTAARLAEATAKALRDAGEAVICASLAALDPRELMGFRHNLFIVSTTGEGDVPDSARTFLTRLGASDLRGTHFSLLALGDSRYRSFCGGGRKVRDTLLEHGAHEVTEWRRADGEPTSTWRDWLATVSRLIGLELGAVEAPETDRPVTLTLIECQRLDHPKQGDTRETWQLTFDTGDTAGDFRPGDLLLVSPGPGEAPRCYSIGTSSLAGDSRIGLTVSLHTWKDSEGKHHLGLTSNYLCHQLRPGAKLDATWRRHPDFNPPDDPTRPLILVATGAGIAPFPGFLAERARQPNAGPVWLLFGNRFRTGDFFYQAAFEQWRREGVLTRLDTAFSRDPDDGHHIQDRLMGNGEELLRWLVERRGVLYTCGRASTVGAAVERTVRAIIASHGSQYGLQPDKTLAQWRKDGTLRVDVFG